MADRAMEANDTSDEFASFYAILNLPRDASDDDVKKSFRQLAQAYHPDKHTDPALKAHAAAQFTQIQEAYEVKPLNALDACQWLLPMLINIPSTHHVNRVPCMAW